MTILIPYRPDIFDGLELLYALRSIEKHLTGYTNLIIIGRPPNWYNGEWVTAEDYPGHKQYTIYQKILIGCELNNVTDDFVFWNDDHFLLRPLNVNDIKYWHNGLLANELNRSLTARYYQAVKNTLSFIPDAMNFDIHTPIKYNKKLFKYSFQNKEDEICIKSYYCNHYKWLDHLVEFLPDCKINDLLSCEAIKQYISGRLFFSTSENSIKPPMRAVLEEMFPNKSQWEK